MNVAGTLRDARERAGLSQTALARRAGTSQATLSAYETGRKQPSVATLSRLLAATGSRLAVEEGHPPLVEPSPARHAQTDRTLVEVISLAEALPTRHSRDLRYPRLTSVTRPAS